MVILIQAYFWFPMTVTSIWSSIGSVIFRGCVQGNAISFNDLQKPIFIILACQTKVGVATREFLQLNQTPLQGEGILRAAMEWERASGAGRPGEL